MDKLLLILNDKRNADKIDPQMVKDWEALPVSTKANAYDADAVRAWKNKWKDHIQGNFVGWEEIDWADGEPLKARMAKDGVNPDLIGNANYLEGLARKYGSTPAEVSKAFAEISKEKAAADEKQKIADEYKREAEARYARQKAVDDYQHSYLGMDLDNPLNIGLNKLADFIISDKTKRAVVEDPNDAGRIAGNIAVDIGGTAADFVPGVGGYVIGPTIRTGRNIAEGDKASDIVREAALDYGGNIALSQGLKGIPGIGDFGPLRKIEDKTIGKWKEVAENLEKDVDFDNVFTVPSFESKGEFFKWAEKLPSATRKDVQKIIASSSEADVRKNLQGYVKKNVEENIRLSENMPYYKKYAAEHPVQTFVGKTIEPVTVGAERTAAERGTRTPTEYKTSSPKKIKTYDDAIGFIIDSNKRQWEAGFKPRDMSGIVGEAYKKWESER